MKENITSMNERGIFNKGYIMDDFKLLTSVIYLVSLPQSNDIIKFNLNLIQTLDPENNNNNKSQEIKQNKNEEPSSNDITPSLDDEHNILQVLK
jgi:hypothetical protein